MTEEFTIYIVIDLKKVTRLEELKSMLKDSAINLNCEQEYFTYETEGINNMITKNNIIYVVEFDNIENLQQYVEFTKTLSKIKIELVCERDNILYMSRQYIKSLDNNIVDVREIEKKIEKYKNNNRYTRLYKLLNI